MIPYRDIADMPEDERIKVIGDFASTGKEPAFALDDEPPKIARYKAKIEKAYPHLFCLLLGRVADQPGVFWIKVKLRPAKN